MIPDGEEQPDPNSSLRVWNTFFLFFVLRLHTEKTAEFRVRVSGNRSEGPRPKQMDLLRGLVLRGLKPKPEPERGRSQTERSRRRRSLLTRPRNGKRRQVPGSVLHGVHAPGGAAGNVKHQLHRYVLAMDAIHREERRKKNGSSGSGGGASPDLELRLKCLTWGRRHGNAV